jgi:hypothetical protein
VLLGENLCQAIGGVVDHASPSEFFEEVIHDVAPRTVL